MEQLKAASTTEGNSSAANHDWFHRTQKKTKYFPQNLIFITCVWKNKTENLIFRGSLIKQSTPSNRPVPIQHFHAHQLLCNFTVVLSKLNKSLSKLQWSQTVVDRLFNVQRQKKHDRKKYCFKDWNWWCDEHSVNNQISL